MQKFPLQASRNILGVNFQFNLDSAMELERVETIETKEKGTFDWLCHELRETDVFYDIGANNGIYSFLAIAILRSKHNAISSLAKVVAFEPHTPTRSSLIKSISLNKLQTEIVVVGAPLYSKVQVLPFYYHSLMAGGSQNELLRPITDMGIEFRPSFCEILVSTTLDEIIRQISIPPPTLIKIDVDGHEPSIIVGMHNVLAEYRPRQVQVEVAPSAIDEVISLMKKYDYCILDQHVTSAGAQKIAAGKQLSEIQSNIIFGY